jgi:hypothetical protein
MRGRFSTRLSQQSAGGVVRDPAQMETLCRTLQWLEKVEDIDQENPALRDLKRAILLEIAKLEITEEDQPNAA